MKKSKKTKSGKKPNGGKLSAVIGGVAENFTGTSTNLGELTKALSGRSYGVLMLVLALPNLFPIPAPGLSAILGLPLMLVTFQLMLGLKDPWLPAFIAKKRLGAKSMQRILKRFQKYAVRFEYVSRPRLRVLIEPPVHRLIAFICFLLSATIMLPVPFGNALPALAVCMFALAILMGDGLLVMVASIVAAGSFAIIYGIFTGAIMSVQEIFGM